MIVHKVGRVFKRAFALGSSLGPDFHHFYSEEKAGEQARKEEAQSNLLSLCEATAEPCTELAISMSAHSDSRHGL
jgi:hypothetical protein